MASETIARQAVVIGAGIAGLAAARACRIILNRSSCLNATDFSMVRFTGRVRLNRGMRMDCWSGDSVCGASCFQASSGTLLKRVPSGQGEYRHSVERPGYDPFPQRDLALMNYALSRPAIEFAVRKRLRFAQTFPCETAAASTNCWLHRMGWR